jgi:hypothetical protein
VVPTTEDRYLIKIGDYSRINLPDFWPGGQMPIRYRSLADVGIDPDTLDFTPIENLGIDSEGRPEPPYQSNDGAPEVRPLSLADAKRGLAATFGVRPEAIDITIRG